MIVFKVLLTMLIIWVNISVIKILQILYVIKFPILFQWFSYDFGKLIDWFKKSLTSVNVTRAILLFPLSEEERIIQSNFFPSQKYLLLFTFLAWIISRKIYEMSLRALCDCHESKHVFTSRYISKISRRCLKRDTSISWYSLGVLNKKLDMIQMMRVTPDSIRITRDALLLCISCIVQRLSG